MATYLEQFIEKVRSFEGSIPWMYQDTAGKVTVGVGLMLPNEAAALALPFLVGGVVAKPEQITAEFNRVKALARGKAASFYRTTNGLQLSDQTIDERLREVARGFEGYLELHLPAYVRLPDAAKVALLDMAYNLGPGRLFAEYPRLLAAIGRGDWTAAAAASARKGPGTERNAWTKEQFLLAAREAVTELKASAEGGAWAALLLGAVSGFAAATAAGLLFAERHSAASRDQKRPTL